MNYEFTKDCAFGKKGKVTRMSPNALGTRRLLSKGMIVERETKVIEPVETKPKRSKKKVDNDEPQGTEQDYSTDASPGGDSEF